jgi:hypothetical protein
MGKFIGIAAALAFIAIVGFIGGLVDFLIPPAPEAQFDRSSSLVAEPPAPLFTHPLPYAATIKQSGDGISEPKLRHYIPTSARGGK